MRISTSLHIRLVTVLLPVLIVVLAGGCTVPEQGRSTRVGEGAAREVAPPDGAWRPHLLRRCAGDDALSLSGRSREVLAVASELFAMGEGGDGIVELELHLSSGRPMEGLVLLTLAQLYVLAGQGEPTVEPREGPAAVTGDWGIDRPRLVARAEDVLRKAAALMPDDATVDYLLADAARSRGDMAAAENFQRAGLAKCTISASFAVLTRYQDLSHHPARQLEGVAPEYPESAARDGVTGDVILDLLVAPTGEVTQTTVVSQPDRRLGRASTAAMSGAVFAPGRIGKYPVWSWVRVTVAFR